MPSPVKAVILDFGGVISLPQDPSRVASMARLCGLSPERFRELYPHRRLELDRGTLGPDEYWDAFLRESGVSPTLALISRLEDEDAWSWSLLNGPVLEWAAELRLAGIRTAILSNMPPDKLTFIREHERFTFLKDFRPTIFSCECSLVKPEPAIFRRCVEGLAVPANQCLFVDDTDVNVAAAKDLGLRTVRYTDLAALAAAAVRDFELPAASLQPPAAAAPAAAAPA